MNQRSVPRHALAHLLLKGGEKKLGSLISYTPVVRYFFNSADNFSLAGFGCV